MAGKIILPVFKTMPIRTLSGASVVISEVTDIRHLYHVAYQFVTTGTLTGTFSVQGSLNYDVSGVHSYPGDWTQVTTGSAAGSGISILLNIQDAGYPYIRVVYTNASGDGTVVGYVSGKGF